MLADRILPLKPGETGSSFGPAFEINLPRPRNKSLFNTDPDYKRLRNEITRYFLDLQALKNIEKSLEEIFLPDIKPVVLEREL